jgi:hypothetical protein
VAVINEEESMCKKPVAASLKVQSRHFARETKEDKEIIVLGNQYSERPSQKQLDSSFFIQCNTLLYSMPVVF